MPNTGNRRSRSSPNSLQYSKICAHCGTNISYSYSIQCSKCTNWFHPKCAGVTVKVLKDVSLKSWLCYNCSETMDDPDDDEENDPDVVELITKTTQLAKHLEIMGKTIRNLATTYDTINKNYEEIQNSVNIIKSKYTAGDSKEPKKSSRIPRKLTN